ncbi:MAG: polysaccharide biosynthesis protein [Glaciimonas sp.]|nr:polysaccharide biosynthesis protein [Glaciimonas sp.]
MAIAFLPAYINYLGVEAYGVIGLFAAVQGMVMILDLGISPTVNRQMARFFNGIGNSSETRNLLYTLEIVCFCFTVISLFVVWLLSHYLSREWLNTNTLQPDQIAHALVLIWFVACLRLCEGVYRGTLFGAGKQIWYNAYFSLFVTIRYAGALVILIWISQTLQAFFMWQIAVSLANIYILAKRADKCFPAPQSPRQFSFSTLSAVKNFAAGTLGIGAMTILLLQLDKVILSYIAPLKDLGYYTLAATAANTMFMVVVPITQAVYPSLVAMSTDQDQKNIAALFRKLTQSVVVMIAPATTLLVLFSGGIIYAWSDNLDLVDQASPLLEVLVIGSFFNCLSHLPFQLQIAFGKTRLLLKIYAFSVFVFCPLAYVLTDLRGAEGAAWAWLIINAVHLTAVTYFTHRSLLSNQSWLWYATDIVPPLLAALLVGFLAIQLKPVDYSQRWQWINFLLATGLISVVFSMVAAPLTRQSVISLLRRR